MQTTAFRTGMVSNGAFVPAGMPMPWIILFTHTSLSQNVQKNW